MLKRTNSTQSKSGQLERVDIELLVPNNHLLRLINDNVDFSFIREKVRPFYSETKGRPSLDPVVLLKMMLVGYALGIRSERQLEQEITLNAAYRWFLGLGFSDSCLIIQRSVGIEITGLKIQLSFRKSLMK